MISPNIADSVMKTVLQYRRGKNSIPVSEWPLIVDDVVTAVCAGPMSNTEWIDAMEKIMGDYERRYPPTPEQLRAFNDERARQFGRAPTPENPLPMTPTGRGGDVGPEAGE